MGEREMERARLVAIERRRSDAIYAAKRSVESANRVLDEAYARQREAYEALARHDATRPEADRG